MAADGHAKPPAPLRVLRRHDWDRFTTAQEWLYRAAASRETAGNEWTQQGVAVLTAGVMWDAVRIPYAVLGVDPEQEHDTEALRGLLAELKLSGPAFCDPYRPFLYVLVPPGTDRQWPLTLSPAGVECLGGTRPYVHYVGVPRVDRLQPPGLFWVTLPDGSSRFTDPQRLFQVLHGRVQESTPLQDAPAALPEVIV
ncbi:hypothetical protein [Streptomyces sp. NPDC056817]|uniref:hypothetical protein n=1 Tax=Streptomyces sp. NPDC056817 TaxID=3345950 RepID=UPI0036B3FFEC